MHRAAQAEDLRLAEVSLPIARKDIQRIPAFRCRHQVGIALAGEVSGRQKIRPDGNAEHFGLRQKRRRKLPAPDSLEGRIALRRERIQISPLPDSAQRFYFAPCRPLPREPPAKFGGPAARSSARLDNFAALCLCPRAWTRGPSARGR